MLGGAVVVLAALLVDGDKYLGLEHSDHRRCLSATTAAYDFLGKLAFTVTTLASGFKGGEVTPLFYIGATLGNALGYLLPLPFPVLAGLGFVAVFAGAANAPIASTIMAIELFGVRDRHLRRSRLRDRLSFLRTHGHLPCAAHRPFETRADRRSGRHTLVGHCGIS